MAKTAKLLNFSVWIDTIECYKCAMVFGMPMDFLRRLRETGDSFYCPNGHSQAFIKSEVDKLRAELERVKASSQREIEWQKGQRLVAEKQLIAKKGQITKLKNRVSKGVCPCCNRSFSNLHQHMTTKHPDYATKD